MKLHVITIGKIPIRGQKHMIKLLQQMFNHCWKKKPLIGCFFLLYFSNIFFVKTLLRLRWRNPALEANSLDDSLQP